MTRLSRKQAGAYYTPPAVASNLVRWAVRKDSDRLLDPSCGDGRFIAAHRNSFGVEQDAEAAAVAMGRAPGASVHQGDFFAWAAQTRERFDCAAGNPPFIRYQTFKGEVRKRALRLCAGLGAEFSGLTASWAPFLVAAASLLKPGGRMAFVVPAAIGHAPYAAPLLDYLVGHFDDVRIVAVRTKLFPELSEDCWLLHAGGFGGRTPRWGSGAGSDGARGQAPMGLGGRDRTAELRFSVLDRFKPTAELPRAAVTVPVREWRTSWNRRLRPYLLPGNVRALYRAAASDPDSLRFGDVASIGIGYVSGANGFFHLRPSEAEAWGVPEGLLHPTVRNGRVLPARTLTVRTIERWRRSDEPMMLLRIPKDVALPPAVSKYLESDRGQQVREGYKCRMRTPWYSVPDVRVPDFFLSYLSGRMPNLVRNRAAATCTNAVHGVHLRDRKAARRVIGSWETPFVRLSCELEGHPLGGGVLKLEPREAARIVLPPPAMASALSGPEVAEAVAAMRAWRHYDAERSSAPGVLGRRLVVEVRAA